MEGLDSEQNWVDGSRVLHVGLADDDEGDPGKHHKQTGIDYCGMLTSNETKANSTKSKCTSKTWKQSFEPKYKTKQHRQRKEL